MRHRTQALGRAFVGGAAALSLSLLLAAPMAAQSPAPTVEPTLPPVTTLTVTTVFPSITVDPGGEATFPLTVLAPQPERVDLTVGSQPDGFKSAIRGNGSIVGSVFTGSIPAPELELRVRHLVELRNALGARLAGRAVRPDELEGLHRRQRDVVGELVA